MIEGKSLLTGEPLTENDLVIKRRFEGYEQPFDLFRCPKSGLVQTLPMPDVDELVDKEYNDSYSAYQDVNLRETQITSSRRLRRMEKYLLSNSTRRLLDVGCSTGWFLKTAKERGYEVAGVEMNPYAAKKANASLGGGVFTGRFEDCEFPKESFDIVYSSAIIEHVSDPVSFIKKQSDYLKKNGLLFINTPNIDSLAWRRLGGNWSMLQLPDHIVFFNPSSITYLLESLLFEVCIIYSAGMPPLSGKKKEYVSRNSRRGRNQNSHRNFTLGRLKHFLLSRPIVSNIVATIIDRFKIGDSMHVIARKR